MSDQHPEFLGHHYETPEQQFSAGKLGMWLFLATEILLFGGLFVAYTVYRATHPEVFHYASEFLDVKLGGINTVILIASSFTMATAVRMAQLGKQRATVLLLGFTLLCAFGFLGIQEGRVRAQMEARSTLGTLYQSQEHHGDVSPHDDASHGSDAVIENVGESPAETPAAAVPEFSDSEGRTQLAAPGEAPQGLADPTGEVGTDTEDAEAPKNVHIFFGIYFLMTGLHGLHVIAGMIAIGWVLVRTLRGHFSVAYSTPVDLVGLYWHLVDLIWIFLFPLLYLIR